MTERCYDRRIAAQPNGQKTRKVKADQPQPYRKQEQSRREEERPQDGLVRVQRGPPRRGPKVRPVERRIADTAREILGVAPGARDGRVSAILASILKSEENLSHWGLIRHFDRHPGDLELCELPRPYCRSWHQLRISETDPAVLQNIIAKMAGCDAVHGTLLVDSGGFQHGRVRRLAERQIRQAQRAAVCQDCTSCTRCTAWCASRRPSPETPAVRRTCA